MNKNQQNIEPETWKKLIKFGIAVLTALLSLLGAGAAGGATAAALLTQQDTVITHVVDDKL